MGNVGPDIHAPNPDIYKFDEPNTEKEIEDLIMKFNEKFVIEEKKLEANAVQDKERRKDRKERRRKKDEKLKCYKDKLESVENGVDMVEIQ